MTQHLKCDYSGVTREIFWPTFVRLFSRVLSINVLFLSELLFVCEIGVMPNFKLEFCSYASLFLWCSEHKYYQIYCINNWKLSSVLMYVYIDRQWCPLLSQKQVKLRTSNFVCIIHSINRKKSPLKFREK